MRNNALGKYIHEQPQVNGGASDMPFVNYGFSDKFGWVQDRFGVSWQLNLP